MSKRPTPTDPSVTEPADDDPFLSRWARRKRVARGGGDPDGAAAAQPGAGESVEPPVEAGGESPAEAPEPPELSDADMPPLETIDEDTDMSGFFSPKVTDAVKKAALRKFFHSPVFNIVDGLDDYDDDFRNFAALGDVITSDMRGRAELEARRAKEALEEKADPPPGADGPAADSVAESGEASAEEEAPMAAADQAATEESLQGEGITRDPARPGGVARGKLVARDPGMDDDDDDTLGEGEDEA